MRIARLLIAACALAAALPACALAQGATSLAVDDVRVGAHRRHTLLVRAEDATGRPVEHLQSSFRATLDGYGVRDLAVRSPFDDAVRATAVAVVDADLLSSATDREWKRQAAELLKAMAGALRPEDHVVVMSAGAKPRRIETTAADLRAAAVDLEPLGAPAAGRLLQVLGDAVDLAARRHAVAPGIVVVITRGGAGAGGARAGELLAHARGGTAIVLARVGTDGAASLGELAGQTGGRSLAFERPGDDPAPLAAAVRSLRGRYELAFTPGEWDGGAATHRIEVRLDQAGPPLTATRSYALADVTEPAWWSSPWVWLTVVVTLAVIAFVLLRLRRRPIAMLVVDGGEEDGCYFEVFATPVTIGCAAGCDILVAGEGISRNHCVLQLVQGRFELVDANSTGGTYVQGQRIGKRELEDDDTIRLGPDVSLVFEDHR